MEKEIIEFFQARKEAWLKKNTTGSMDVEAIKSAQADCDEQFSVENWLPNAAKRAGQISISTHPCTFSHPSSRKNKNGYVSSVIAESVRKSDGFLRSGNVVVQSDALGNAAALDVYKFLMLKMEDGNNLLSHIQQDSELAIKLLTIKSSTYDDLKAGFMAMVEAPSENVTSSKIKQVYFPVGNDYHQLSLLTASGIVFELRKRIDTLRFSDQAKEARICQKEKKLYLGGYKQLNNITTIGYGGTKPQNISVLNNQNGGKAHLLLSVPPTLEKRDVQFPSVDFFSQTISPFQFRSIYFSLHKIFTQHKNNNDIRAERFKLHQELIVDQIIETMTKVRGVAKQQYSAETSQLSKAQKIWLCNEYSEVREQEEDWLDEIIFNVSQFIFHGYEKVLKKQALKFGDGEYKNIYQQVEKAKEGLR